ncbi:hypothetical protein BCU94_19190 [Shewanella sp. 10N.286.52.C2]|nr:hypothetical protein BCU94_19190 [Shewanella sp. 10N.286.52.C2]
MGGHVIKSPNIKQHLEWVAMLLNRMVISDADQIIIIFIIEDRFNITAPTNSYISHDIVKNNSH